MKDNKWRFTIKSPRQENGLWGVPIQLRSWDNPYICGEHNEVLQSAIIIGIAEAYPDETFSIWHSTEKGFKVSLNESGWKSISYEDYELSGDTLIWVGFTPE